MKNILFSIVAMFILVACGEAPDSTDLVADLDAGRAIAEAECADCHGMDGRGATPEIPHLTAQPVQYLVEAMHAYRDGSRVHAALQDMTAGMSEAEILHISAYYASQSPLEAMTGTSGANAAYLEGASVAALCEHCHGVRGVSTSPGVPNLAGQQPAYLIASTQAYQRGERGHEDKVDMLSGLEQVDIEKMAMYFAAQPAPARNQAPFGDPIAGRAQSAGCGKCHGARGVSHDPLVPSLAGQDPVYLVNAIKAYRDNHGRVDEADMPERTDAQIENLAAYYSGQPLESALEGEMSVQDMAAKCNRCHDPASGARKLNVPTLRGQSYDYLVKSMKEYRQEDRHNSMMHKMSARYSDEMIEAIAAHYASQ